MWATPASKMVLFPSNRGPSTALDSLSASVPPESLVNRGFAVPIPVCSYVHAGPSAVLTLRAGLTVRPADPFEAFRVG